MSDLMKKLDEYFDNLSDEKYHEVSDRVDKELKNECDCQPWYNRHGEAVYMCNCNSQ